MDEAADCAIADRYERSRMTPIRFIAVFLLFVLCGCTTSVEELETVARRKVASYVEPGSIKISAKKSSFFDANGAFKTDNMALHGLTNATKLQAGKGWQLLNR